MADGSRALVAREAGIAPDAGLPMTESRCTFHFYRHAMAVISLGGVRMLVDPMNQKAGRLPPVPSVMDFRWNPIQELTLPFPRLTSNDILLITHHHFDHFDRAASLEIDKTIPVVTPENGVRRLQRWGFKNIHPLRPLQRTTIGEIEIEAVPVKHTERLGKLLYKPGVGYLIGANNKTVYISGDTILFDGLLNCLKDVRIDLAVLYGGGARIPLLGRHTLSHREIISMVRSIKPGLAVVTHLDCLNHCPETSDQLSEMLNKDASDLPIRIAEPGREYSF
ncbi:MAG: MBL fold metallo-hydrolase [Candidatus Zixiibacteriota bacterium]|nr:MAG: MBL fold metallo-hydrolase [candidate division Zixibacteria bacterium]